jgi:hypothetical protein
MYDSQKGEDSIFGISMMRDGRFLPVFVVVPVCWPSFQWTPRGVWGSADVHGVFIVRTGVWHWEDHLGGYGIVPGLIRGLA